MKSFRLFLVGVLCVITIGLTTVSHKVRADGIKPVDTSDAPTPVPSPCDCRCTEVSITSTSYEQFAASLGPLLGGQNDIVKVKVHFVMSSECAVKIVTTIRALRYSMTDDGEYTTWYDPWTPLDSEKGSSAGTIDTNGTAPYGEGKIAWWEVQTYVVRVCDNTIVGWTDVDIVVPGV